MNFRKSVGESILSFRGFCSCRGNCQILSGNVGKLKTEVKDFWKARFGTSGWVPNSNEVMDVFEEIRENINGNDTRTRIQFILRYT